MSYIVQCAYAKMGTPTEVPFLRQPDPLRTIAGLLHNTAKFSSQKRRVLGILELTVTF